MQLRSFQQRVILWQWTDLWRKVKSLGILNYLNRKSGQFVSHYLWGLKDPKLLFTHTLKDPWVTIYTYTPRTSSELKWWTHSRKQWTFPFSLLALKLYKTPLWSQSFGTKLWTSQAFLTNLRTATAEPEEERLSCFLGKISWGMVGAEGFAFTLSKSFKVPLNSHLHKNIKPVNCQTR